jgi:transcriptional regulator with XRE-family HTH domain
MLTQRAASGTLFDLSESPAESRRKMKISGAQVKAARDLLKITQAELAESAGIAERTVRKFEGDGLLEPANLEKILNELGRRGIEFTNGTGIGVRLNFEKAAQFARQAGQVRKDSDH